MCLEGVKGTSGTCLELLLTWFPVVPAARMEHGCGAGLAHSSPPLVPGGLRAGGGVGLVVRKCWTSCQETLWEAKGFPGLGRWKRWHKEGSVCVLRVPTLHPRSRKSIGVVWRTQIFCLRALGEPTKAVADAASLAGCCCPGAWIPGALLPACREPWTTPRDHGMPGSGETLR